MLKINKKKNENIIFFIFFIFQKKSLRIIIFNNSYKLQIRKF